MGGGKAAKGNKKEQDEEGKGNNLEDCLHLFPWERRDKGKERSDEIIRTISKETYQRKTEHCNRYGERVPVSITSPGLSHSLSRPQGLKRGITVTFIFGTDCRKKQWHFTEGWIFWWESDERGWGYRSPWWYNCIWKMSEEQKISSVVPSNIRNKRGRKLMEEFAESNNSKICMKGWEPSSSFLSLPCWSLFSVAPVVKEGEAVSLVSYDPSRYQVIVLKCSPRS